MAALTPPKATPHGQNDALPNVVMSFDKATMGQFYASLKEGRMNTELPGLFPLSPKSHLLEFEMQMGEHGDSSRSGFEYNIVLSEVNDEFQVRMLEHFAHTKKFSGNILGGSTEYGGAEKLASLYIAWGWGRDAKTWSSVHRGLINNINYEFNAFSDKVLRIQLFDDISFFLDLPAATESRLEVEEPYISTKSIGWNFSNIISKFLAGVFYDSFVVVDFDDNAVKALEDAAEKHSNAEYTYTYSPTWYRNNTIGIGMFDPELVVGDETQMDMEQMFKDTANQGKSHEDILTEKAAEIREAADSLDREADAEKDRRENFSKNWSGQDVTRSVNQEEDRREKAAEMREYAAVLDAVQSAQGSTVPPQSTNEVNAHLAEVFSSEVKAFGIKTVVDNFEHIDYSFRGKQDITDELFKLTELDDVPAAPAGVAVVDNDTRISDDLPNWDTYYWLYFYPEMLVGVEENSSMTHRLGAWSNTLLDMAMDENQLEIGQKANIQNNITNWMNPASVFFKPNGHNITHRSWNYEMRIDGESPPERLGWRTVTDGSPIYSAHFDNPCATTDGIKVIGTVGNMLQAAAEKESAADIIDGPAAREFRRWFANEEVLRDEYEEDVQNEATAIASDNPYIELLFGKDYQGDGFFQDFYGQGDYGMFGIMSENGKARQNAAGFFYNERNANSLSPQELTDKLRKDAVLGSLDEVSNGEYNIRFHCPAGKTIREIMFGGSSKTEHSGLLEQLSEFFSGETNQNADMEFFTLPMTSPLVPKAAKSTNAKTFVFFGSKSKAAKYSAVDDEALDALYHKDSSYRRIYSLKCTTAYAGSRNQGAVIDDLPEHKTAVFTFGRPGRETLVDEDAHVATPVSDPLTDFAMVKQEPTIIDIDYDLKGYFLLSLLQSAELHKNKSDFIAGDPNRTFRSILTRLAVQDSSDPGKILDTLTEFQGGGGMLGDRSFRKRWAEFFGAVGNGGDVDTEYSNFRDSGKGAGKLADLGEDLKTLFERVRVTGGDGNASDADPSYESIFDLIFGLKLGVDNTRFIGTDNPDLGQGSEVIKMPMLVHNFSVEGGGLARDGAKVQDMLKIAIAKRYAKMSTMLHSITITVPGVPELDTLGELGFGQAPRDYKIQIFEHRDGFPHFLSGMYRLFGISHRIDVQGGYVTRLHLVNNSHLLTESEEVI